ncbi:MULTISPECIES: hypothetical protein [Microbacterium]|uniref:hypothetical protein n=1 Tax=Microbacterium TaxID=33882 RepID=UPI001C2C2FF9|nr:hypothetical protein [Microbacterium paraoxydans]QXE28925.1 hypothetical protein IZR02_11040 [Microbacterium paraoxydans]
MTHRSDHGRPLEAQLATARMLLGQYAAQIDEYDGMNREQRRTPRGRDLASRITGLRAGLKKWMTRAAELEKALEDEPHTDNETEGHEA